MLRPSLRLATRWCITGCFALATSFACGDSDRDAKQILNQSGVSAGFVVQLGAGDGELTAALRQNDATGNSVAHDDVVAPPRHLQWVGSPRWSRHHDRMASMSALVSTAGRMFYIMDEGSRVSIQLPPKWKLIARDAFNGSVLWKRDIPDWQPHLWPLKSGPTQLSRRLVSSDDAVFVTLGYNAPLTALDAATGKTLRTYEGSDATEEIIHTGGLLFLVVRKGEAELQHYAPLHGTVGDQARSRNFFWNEEPRVLMAFEANTGKQLWAKQTKVSPLTLAADGTQVYFHDGEKVVSLDQRSGEIAWETEPVMRRQSFTFNFGPRLVIHEDVVLYAGGDGEMFSVNSQSGEKLWDASFPNSGYQSPQDLMVVGGLVWLAPLTSGKELGDRNQVPELLTIPTGSRPRK